MQTLFFHLIAETIMTINNQILLSALNARKYDDYLTLENIYYNKQVKIIEDQSHYNQMFSATEQAGIAYGNILRKEIKIKSKKIKNRICYFLPSIDNDLAHIELLYAILKSSNNSGFKIYVAGFSDDDKKAKSILLNELQKNGLIEIVNVKYTHKGVIDFINFVEATGISQLIVTSIPILLVPLLEVFGSNMVTWFSMKFELTCFSKLINRISFCGSTLHQDTTTNIKWMRNPPAILDNSIKWSPNISKSKQIKLLTINREEKIRNPLFLKSICQILEANQNAHFYWTGRSKDVTIQNYFETANIHDRTHFIGWVDPKTTIPEFDIFLDTPYLSGSIAAKAFACGMPVATFKNSQSWIDFYSNEIGFELQELGDINGINSILFEDTEQYVQFVSKLIVDNNYYQFISKLQWYLGTKYFKNLHNMSHQHFENVNKTLEYLSEQ